MDRDGLAAVLENGLFFGAVFLKPAECAESLSDVVVPKAVQQIANAQRQLCRAQLCVNVVVLVIISSTTFGGGGYVFIPFCVFVCLCAGYLKKLWMDPDEIL